MISSKAHGYLDYLMGALFILLPFVLNFPEGAATILLIVLGAATIIYSLMTDYELSVVKIIPMKIHLGIDLVAGLLLITAPWLFDFADEVIWPFVILGLIEVDASLMTAKIPQQAKNDTR